MIRISRVICLALILVILLAGCSEKPPYQELKDNLILGEKTIKVHLEKDEVSDLLLSVLRQEPLILGEDNNYQVNFGSKLKVNYRLDKKEILLERVKVRSKLEAIALYARGKELPEMESVRYLHDYLVKVISYDVRVNEFADLNEGYLKYPESYDIYGALVNGVAVCSGYAESFKASCDILGLSSIVITGTYKGVPHAWNKVRIDGFWYNIDLTANDTGVPYTTYLKNDSELKNYIVNKDFMVDSQISIYDSQLGKSTLEYYSYNKLSAKNYDEVLAYITEGVLAFRLENLSGDEVLNIVESSGLNVSQYLYTIDDGIFYLKKNK